MDEIIRVENLSKTFDSVAAVDGLTFSVRKGEVFGIVGPDGAGKTTTMRLLTSIMDPTSGDAWVAGHHIVKESEQVKENIGYMSQRFGLYEDLSVMENIHFYGDIFSVPRKGRAEKIDRLLSFSNLAPFKKRLAGNLSGGMKQKLGLVCALIHTPRVLFLDEPTNGVDPVSRRDFWRILGQLLHEQVTILVSTAYLDEAERCHRIGLIHKGKMLASGSPKEVKTMMQGAILEVRSSQPRRAFDCLRQKLRSGYPSLFGDRIHVVAEDSEKTSQEIKTLLKDEDLSLAGIRTVEPSLEDVFVSVLGQNRESHSHDDS